MPKELKTKLMNLCNKILAEQSNLVTVIFKPSKNKEKEFILILAHELIHYLLSNNGVEFWRINSKYALWDEGLCIYLHFWATKQKLNFRDNEDMNPNKWKELLKKTKTPFERRRIIQTKFKNL